MRWRPAFAVLAIVLSLSAPGVGAETLEVAVSADEGVISTTPGTAMVSVAGVSGVEPLTREIDLPGRATFEVPSGSTARVSVTAAGWWARTQVVHVTSARLVTVHLQPTGWISGAVRITDGEEMPEALQVRLRAPAGTADGPPDSQWRCPITETRFRCEVPHGTFDLRVRAKGFISHYRWGLEVPAREEIAIGALNLQPGASVVGWIEAPSQDFRFDEVEVRLKPVAAGDAQTAHGQARFDSLQQEAGVNSRGFFEISAIAPGSYTLRVEHRDYAPARITPVTVLERAETEIHRIALQPAVGLDVRFDPPTGPFHRHWQVELFEGGEVPGHAVLVATGTADREGRWRAGGLAPGEYEIRVGTGRGARWASREVTVVDGLPPVEIALPYDRLEGTLLLGGEPLAATLYFGGRFGARRVAIQSDDEGKFYVILPRQEEPWFAEIVASELDLEVRVTGIEVRKTPEEPWAKVEIDLPANHVRGVVVDEVGAPVAGVLVEAVGDDGGRPASARSAQTGEFEVVGLEEGSYELEALHVRDGRQLSADPVAVEVSDDEDVEGVRIVLREDFSLDGMVFSPSGQGIPGAQVLVRLDDSVRPLVGTMPSATTGLDGEFQLRLPRGASRMIVSVLAPGYAMRSLVADAGESDPLLIELDQVGGTLVVSYTGSEEISPTLLRHRTQLFHPHLVAPSGLLRQWAELHGERQNDPARYVVPMLEPGPYTACYDVGFSILFSGRLPVERFDNRCESGVLSPYGELHLTVQVPDPKEETGE